MATALTEAFQRAFQANADAEAALAMRAYMREKFPFLGIKTPERRKLTRPLLGTYGKLEGDLLRATVDKL